MNLRGRILQDSVQLAEILWERIKGTIGSLEFFSVIFWWSILHAIRYFNEFVQRTFDKRRVYSRQHGPGTRNKLERKRSQREIQILQVILWMSGLESRYTSGQYFSPHVDSVFKRSTTERSGLTAMIYLNGGFEDGCTNFLVDNHADLQGDKRVLLKVVPEAGRMLIFSHNIVHGSENVVSCDRFRRRYS